MNSFWVLFLLFSIYSFLGWICESIYCSLLEKRLINRGFLNGPFCPVYGVGAVLILSVLDPFRDRIVLLFLLGSLLTTMLEYLTGLSLETLFHAKYWDYSKRRFNFQGRVCLGNALLFGLMGVAAATYIQPFLLEQIGRIPIAVLPFLSGGLIVYFLADTALTVYGIAGLNGKLRELQLILDELRDKAILTKVETLEALQMALPLNDSTRARLNLLFEKKTILESGFRRMQRRLLRAFPTMKSQRYKDSLLRFRELLQNRAKNIRK